MNFHAAHHGCRLALMAMAIGCLVSPRIAIADDTGSPPLIEFALGLPGKQVKLNWYSEPGVRYHVEKSSSIGAGGGSGGGWARVAMIEATGPSVEWRDPQSVTERCFYRVTKPRAEVFAITPPVLNASGGILDIHGQCLPAGSTVELLDDSGAVVGSFPLTGVSAGLYRSSVIGAFPPGSHFSARVVVPGSGPLGSPVPLAVTLSGLASDAPASLPPAAPMRLFVPWKGIGTFVNKGSSTAKIGPILHLAPGSSAASLAGRKGYDHYKALTDSAVAPSDDSDFAAAPEDDVDYSSSRTSTKKGDRISLVGFTAVPQEGLAESVKAGWC